MKKAKTKTASDATSTTATTTTPTKPTPTKKPRRTKREKPKMFYTNENFKGSADFVLKTADKVTEITDFRMMVNKEKSRGVVFMNNEFMGQRDELVSTPTIFFSNFWKEKKENLKYPEVSIFLEFYLL